MVRARDLYKKLLEGSWTDEAQKKEFIAELLASEQFSPERLLKRWRRSEREEKERIEEILGGIDNEDHLNYLIDALSTHDYILRNSILKMLSKVKIVPSHERLIKLLRSPYEDVRIYSEKLLLAQGGWEAFELLQKEILDGHWHSRKEAIKVLTILGKESSIPALAKLMKSAPRDALRQIVDHLAGFDSGLAMRALEETLTDREAAIRLKSLRALERSKSPRVVELIMNLLEDVNKEVRKEAITFLCQFREKRMVLPFIKCLRDRDYEIKIIAIRTLGEIGDQVAFEPLLLTPTGADERLEKETLQALFKLSQADDIAIVESIIKIVRTADEAARKKAILFLSSQENENVIRRFLRYVIQGEWWVRERVIRCLSDIRSAAFDRVIMNYLELDRDEMRGFALDVVGKLKKAEAVDTLLRIMDKFDRLMQHRVITVLGEIGDRKAVPFVTKHLRVEESRWAAVEALGLLGDPGSFQALIDVWKSSTNDEKVTIADALRRIDERRAVEYLKKFLFDEDPLLRGKVKDIIDSAPIKEGKVDSVENLVLLSLSPKRTRGACEKLAEAIKGRPFEFISSVINMLRMENPDLCGEVVGYLVERMNPEEVKELISFIASIDTVDRNRILDSLCTHESEALNRVIIELLSSGNMMEKHLALEAVNRMGLGEALPLLVEMLPEATLSTRELVFQAMMSIGDERVVDEMIRCLEVPDLRWQASEVLGKLKAKKATHALIKAADDPRPEVVVSILEALRSIGDSQAEAKVRELTHHREKKVRIRALETLQILRVETDSEREAFKKLVELALWDETESADEAIAKLKQRSLKDLDFLDMLVRIVEREGISGSEKVLNLLERLGDKEPSIRFLSLINEGNEKSKENVITALGRTKNKLIINGVLGLISGPGAELDELRSFAITIAQKAKLTEAIPSLLSILDESDWVRRNYIIETLGIVGDPDAVEPILKYLNDPYSSWTVIEALGEIKDKRAVSRLIKGMKGASSDILVAAIRALGKIGDPSAKGEVREYRYDEDTKIRLAAIEVANKLETLS